MKYAISYLLVFVLFIGCSNKDKLTFDTLEIKEQTCTECPKIDINIPRLSTESKLAQSVNGSLKEELISLLVLDDEIELNDIKDAIRSFNNGYTEMKTLFADESASWEAVIKGKVVFEDANLLTIALDSYLFTGGAHGYSRKSFLNFDKTKGTELENRELFSNMEKFKEFAEVKFREQEAIPENDPINNTGFMFEQDRFYLPENIGFTKEGLTLLYNPYEVASFSDGTIELVLLRKQIEQYLVKRTKP
ncbi:DUF3298 and DUF4163 domain-containing protein [bacterium]|nr:DUF3298 and DUF4163 domain-containing protein [bacterium]